jgi:adenosylcobinamide-GDP ribazoletransferase
MNFIRPFFIALQFLTVIPVRLKHAPTAEAQGWSVVYYPLVGLLLGAFLIGSAWLCVDLPPAVGAALVLTLWVLLTGALHLDGLADCADAWVGGLGDRQKTLDIMKDPRAGPMAVIALALVLLLKFTALQTLLAAQHWQLLLIAPMFSRSVPCLLFFTTPYARPDGLGRSAALQMPRLPCYVMLAMVVLTMIAVLGMAGLWLIGSGMALLAALRWLMLRRINGITGDTIGASIELLETMTLILGLIFCRWE